MIARLARCAPRDRTGVEYHGSLLRKNRPAFAFRSRDHLNATVRQAMDGGALLWTLTQPNYFCAVAPLKFPFFLYAFPI